MPLSRKGQGRALVILGWLHLVPAPAGPDALLQILAGSRSLCLVFFSLTWLLALVMVLSPVSRWVEGAPLCWIKSP